LIADALAEKRRVLGLTEKMSNKGVKYGDIADLAYHAVRDACLVTNPRYASVDDLKVIYGEAL
jgi:alcohol dehydrogenase class IV